MKRVISIIAAVAIAMSFTTAFAANADNMQEVLVSVKSRIDVPEEYSEFSSSEQTVNGSTEYNFYWYTENYEKEIYITSYDDGTITGYYKYEGYYGKDAHMSSMSADEAKAIAEDFVKKINPDYPYELVVEGTGGASLNSTSRHFPIKIYINGISLSGEMGSVTVNEETGTVTDFNIWYEPSVKILFNSSDDFISKEDAEKNYTEIFPMELVYRSYYDSENEQKVFYPVYTETNGYNEYISALTGDAQKIERTSNFYAGKGYSYATTEDSAAMDRGLTEREIAEIDTINGLISKEDIEAQLRNNKTLGIPSEISTNAVRLYKSGSRTDDNYMYQVTFRSNDEDNYMVINVNADAKTGEINQFYRFVKVPDQEVYTRNDDTLNALAGDKADEYRYDEETKQYRRYVNGIRVEGDMADISYNGDVLTSYYINYSDADFPSADGAMSAEEATEKMFEIADYKVVCVLGGNDDNETCVYPVYTTWYPSINPFTGKAVDYNNEEITGGENTGLNYSDISGHYAEKYIDALAEYGIGFEGGEFKPDEKITQSDLLTLLGTIYGGGDVIVFLDSKVQADSTYSRAISRNIINEDERDDNAVLTRETASVYLIRAIGAEQYAKYNDIYVTPFDDVTENKGYIALLSAMGVVNGDGGHFNPKREITRAEFAVMLYNYLNR